MITCFYFTSMPPTKKDKVPLFRYFVFSLERTLPEFRPFSVSALRAVQETGMVRSAIVTEATLLTSMGASNR